MKPKIFISLLFVFVLSGCNVKPEDPVNPLVLSGEDIVLRKFYDHYVEDIEADTLYILSGNGGYTLARIPSPYDEDFEKYIAVFIEGDMIIAKRTGLPFEGELLAGYLITDTKKRSVSIIVSSSEYFGHF